MESAKVFIDTDNEITFILEKILSSKSDKVCLVVPDRAAIFTSISGLKLIKRMLDKSGKMLVLVTLDPNGAELAKNAGLFVVARVGEITDALWENVKQSKFDAIKKDTKKVFYLPETKEEKPAEVETKESKDDRPQERMNLSELLEDTLADEDSSLVVAEAPVETEIADVPTIRIKVDNEDIEEKSDEIEAPSVEEAEKTSEVPWQETLQTTEKIESAEPTKEEIHLVEEAEETFGEPQEPNVTSNVRQRRRASADATEPLTINFLEGQDVLGQKKN